jgi:beta-galactosidase
LFDDTQDLGFRWDVVREAQLREDNWPRRVMDALRSSSVDYDLADTHVASGRLARYPVVFLQTADFMSADDQQPLLEYARNGGALVVGPGMPYLDEYLRPKRVLAEHAMDPGTFSIGLGHLVWATDQDVAECVRRLVRPAEFRADDTRLEVVPHYHEDQTLLFVSNPTPQPIAATLRFEGERTFSTAWAEPRSERVRDELAVELRPYSVDIWAVSR